MIFLIYLFFIKFVCFRVIKKIKKKFTKKCKKKNLLIQFEIIMNIIEKLFWLVLILRLLFYIFLFENNQKIETNNIDLDINSNINHISEIEENLNNTISLIKILSTIYYKKLNPFQKIELIVFKKIKKTKI